MPLPEDLATIPPTSAALAVRTQIGLVWVSTLMWGVHAWTRAESNDGEFVRHWPGHVANEEAARRFVRGE